MAKKRSSNDASSRLQMDYLEYMELYNRRKKPARQQPANEEETPPEKQVKPASTPVLTVVEHAKSDSGEEVREDTRAVLGEEHAPYDEPPAKALIVENPLEDDDEDAFSDDSDELDIQNPFMDIFHRAKTLTQKASAYIGKKKEDEDDDGEGEADGEDPEIQSFDDGEEEAAADLYAEDSEETGESLWTRVLAKIGFKPLDDEDLDEDEIRRKYSRIAAASAREGTAQSFHRSFEANSGDEKVLEDIDPIFTMDSERATDTRERRWEAGEDAAPEMAKMPGRTYDTATHRVKEHEEKYDNEGDDVMADESKNKQYDDLLGYDTGEAPSVSRRERKAREVSASPTSTKKYPYTKPDLPPSSYDDDVPVDEPTQEFTPIRARLERHPKPPASERRTKLPVPESRYEDYDDYDEEDDEEEIDIPVKTGKRKPQRVYSDYDEDYDSDDYGDESDEYDEHDDYDYDDEEDDGNERSSVGRHILGVLKALFAIVLIVVVLVIGLRLLESASIISLDGVRDSISPYAPVIESILPPPENSTDGSEDADGLPEDALGDAGDQTDSGDDFGLPAEGDDNQTDDFGLPADDSNDQAEDVNPPADGDNDQADGETFG